MGKIAKNKRMINFILIACITLCGVFCTYPHSLTVQATTSTEMQNQIQEHENELESLEGQITTLSDEQDILQEKIDDLNAEIINTMSSISLKEDEIAVKENVLQKKHNEVLEKQEDVERTYEEYLAAKEREEQQYADLMVWMRCMYENSHLTYLAAVLQGDGLAKLLNQMDYVEKIYQYGMNKLDEYENTKISVKDLWHILELEKAQLEKEEISLQEERQELLVHEKLLKEQKKELDAMLEKKKKESENYDAEIKRYVQSAAAMHLLLTKEREQLRELQEQEKQESLAESQESYTDTGYATAIDKAKGSELGKKIAKYACQYIGNSYVYGGTSLTEGADCSGFVYRVYKDFGYELPRTSYEQRSIGTAVNLSDAQPGDVVCYDGHVGIYIGDSTIVHASNSNPYPRGGIKISKVDYRPVLSVRRVL